MVNKKTKKATKSPKRTKVATRPGKKMKVAPAVTPAATPATQPTPKPITRNKTARAHIAEGTRLFALAGRPTKAQFVKVYGTKGPTMTWAERAKAGVSAGKFQAALAEKSKA
jgi:hypothetical protein